MLMFFCIEIHVGNLQEKKKKKTKLLDHRNKPGLLWVDATAAWPWERVKYSESHDRAVAALVKEY